MALMPSARPNILSRAMNLYFFGSPLPWNTISPHAGVGSCGPTCRNDSAASARITLPTAIVPYTMIGWSARQLGIDENGWSGFLLQLAAFAVAVLADFLLLLYVLTLLPGVEPPRRRLIVAALIGAVGFELLKLLLSSYMRDVASRSMYGAFGVPVALLLWINFTAKLVLFCAAWTATRHEDPPDPVTDAGEHNAVLVDLLVDRGTREPCLRIRLCRHHRQDRPHRNLGQEHRLVEEHR